MRFSSRGFHLVIYLPRFHNSTLLPTVSGWGTGGTITGVGEMLRLARPETQIIATEPEGAQLLAGKPFTPHKIQVRANTSSVAEP